MYQSPHDLHIPFLFWNKAENRLLIYKSQKSVSQSRNVILLLKLQLIIIINSPRQIPVMLSDTEWSTDSCHSQAASEINGSSCSFPADKSIWENVARTFPVSWVFLSATADRQCCHQYLCDSFMILTCRNRAKHLGRKTETLPTLPVRRQASSSRSVAHCLRSSFWHNKPPATPETHKPQRI